MIQLLFADNLDGMYEKREDKFLIIGQSCALVWCPAWSPFLKWGPSFYDVRKFLRFFIPTPSRRQFFTTIRQQIWPIFDPSPLKNADVLNGWSHVLRLVTVLHCKAKQGRTGGVQGNPVIESGWSCNFYRISPCYKENSNDCRITLPSSKDFPAGPLFYPVWHSSLDYCYFDT